jgi:hypothetical protein
MKTITNIARALLYSIGTVLSGLLFALLLGSLVTWINPIELLQATSPPFWRGMIPAMLFSFVLFLNHERKYS